MTVTENNPDVVDIESIRNKWGPQALRILFYMSDTLVKLELLDG